MRSVDKMTMKSIGSKTKVGRFFVLSNERRFITKLLASCFVVALSLLSCRFAAAQTNVTNQDGHTVFRLVFSGTNDNGSSTGNLSADQRRAVTQAAQYWVDVLKPTGTMPLVVDADGNPILDGNGNEQYQPAVIYIGTVDENNAFGSPLDPIRKPNESYSVHLSTALLGDGYFDPATYITYDENGNPEYNPNTPAGAMWIGNGYNTTPNAVTQTGGISNNLATTAIHEFGHILGVLSPMEELRRTGENPDSGDYTALYKFPERLTRFQSHLRDNNGNSAVPGAHPNVDGKPVDYDSTQGNQYIFDSGDTNASSQPANFTFLGHNSIAVYCDGNESLIQKSIIDGVGVPLQGLVPNQYINDPDFIFSEDPTNWIFDAGGSLSHINIRNSTMSWQMYRNYPMFLEVELALMQDLGYDINRKNFYGRSFYVNGDGESIVHNTQGFNSSSVYGIGLHLFASNLNVVQQAGIRVTGPGAAGIRVDGVGNTLTIAQGTTIHAGLAAGQKISWDERDRYINYGVLLNETDINGNPLTNPTLKTGIDGTGLLVSYGKDHHIIHRGTIIADGDTGTAVRFDFGEPYVGGRLGSYGFDPYYGFMEEGKVTGGYPEELQGPLVKSFDITGTIKGSKARASGPTFSPMYYTTISLENDDNATIIIDGKSGEIQNFNGSWGPHPAYENTGTGDPDNYDPDNDAANGVYGQHCSIEDPDWIERDSGTGERSFTIGKDEILVIIRNEAGNLVEARVVTKGAGYTTNQDNTGCWEIEETATDDYFVPAQPTVSMDVEGGAIYIAGSKLDVETSSMLGYDVVQGGAYVETINIMQGADIEGDIFSAYGDAEGRTTTLTFGLKADGTGKATSAVDSSFHFVYLDNIGYAFPYFEKAFDVLPHRLEVYGNYEYINGAWVEVGEGNGRFQLSDMVRDGNAPDGGFDLRLAGGYTQFGTRETSKDDEWLNANVSYVNSVTIDYGATLEMGSLLTTSATGEERLITRSLYVSDNEFVNNGRLSGESGIWDGGGWIWKEGDPTGEVGIMVYEPDTGWVGKRGGGIWINGTKGTFVNKGTIAPGPNNGLGEVDNSVKIGRRTGTLAIAGNLNLNNKNSVYEVTITDGRQETATSPGWDSSLYWYTDPDTEELSLKASDPKTPWYTDPVTGLPVYREQELIGGGWGVGTSDKLLVSGTTTLGGTLRIHVTPGNYSPDPTTYTIIQSEGGFTSGTNFENFEHYIGFLTFKPYTLNASNTYISPNNNKLLQFSVIRDPDYFKNHGETFNEISVATAIDNSLADSYEVAFSLADKRNTTADLRNMYHQIGGSVRANSAMLNLWNPADFVFNRIGYGNGQMSTDDRGRINWDRIKGRSKRVLGQSPQTRRNGSVWADTIHTSFDAESDGNSDDYKFSRTGFMIGGEWNLSTYSAVGAIAAYTDGTLKQVGDKVESDDYMLGLYFVCAPFNEIEMKTYIGLGFQEYDMKRHVANANIIYDSLTEAKGIYDRYVSDTKGNSFNFSFEVTRPWMLHPTFILRPTLGVDVQHVWQNSFSENNFSSIPESYGSNLYALSYKKMHYERALLRAGFSTETSGFRGGLRMRAFYVTNFGDDAYPTSKATFKTGGDQFEIRGVKLSRNYLNLGIGSNLWLDGERTTSIFFDYDSNIYMGSHKTYNHNVSAGFVLNF